MVEVKRRILIVDDIPDNIHILANALRDEFTVVAATSGKKALQIAHKETSVDLIILDIMMPEMDGYEVCRALKQSEMTRDTPVLFMSALSDENAILKGFEVGGVDYLTKPFNQREAIVRIRTQLELSLQRKQLQKQLLQEQEDRIKHEKTMIQQEKMAAMGEMIGLITHQWRQPLSVISSVSSNMRMKIMLSEEKVSNEAVTQSLELIDSSVHFLSDTIMDFRNFFKQDKSKQTMYLNELVERTISLVGESLNKEGVELDMSACSYEKMIKVFSNELVQVLMNIINNSVDALVELKVKDPKIIIRSDENENEQKIYIEDNAGGIPEELINNIFDANFTTKEEDKGTGLGLYMSKIIVEEHSGGTLSVENYQDGACFCITLPFEPVEHEDTL